MKQLAHIICGGRWETLILFKELSQALRTNISHIIGMAQSSQQVN